MKEAIVEKIIKLMKFSLFFDVEIHRGAMNQNPYAKKYISIKKYGQYGIALSIALILGLTFQ
ncbi:MAG: hypothetical protein MJ200_01705 [Mycoplasmoidaceae bacterium]|nr:hypothetical protein [Mycoplasmoidaceae bacterium]